MSSTIVAFTWRKRVKSSATNCEQPSFSVMLYQIYHEDTKSLGASRPDSLVVGRTVNESRGGDR